MQAKLEDVDAGSKINILNEIFMVINPNKEKDTISCLSLEDFNVIEFDKDYIVNLDYWNYLNQPSFSDFVEAYAHGAEIEYCECYAIWEPFDGQDWSISGTYRFKQPHTIVIDGKEIGISDESYEKLKQIL